MSEFRDIGVPRLVRRAPQRDNGDRSNRNRSRSSRRAASVPRRPAAAEVFVAQNPDDEKDDVSIPISRINVIHPQHAQGVDAPRYRGQARRVVRLNGGREAFNIVAVNPEAETVTVKVTVLGLYEIVQGENRTSAMRDFSHEFEVHNVYGSEERLQRGIRKAWRGLVESIQDIMEVSGYKVFVPMHYSATTALSEADMNHRVQARDEIPHYARMPLNFQFLRKFGVADEDLEPENSERKLNCVTSMLIRHMERYRIMVRDKWDEQSMAHIMIWGKPQHTKSRKVSSDTGISIEQCKRWFDYHQKFNLYVLDQYGNLCSQTKYTSQYKPFMFVSHDAHCYYVSDEKMISSHAQRFRALQSSNLFVKEKKENEKLSAEETLIKLLKRPCHKFNYSGRGTLDMNALQSFSDCNLFVNTKCIFPMLIDIMEQTRFVHQCKCQNGKSFMRIDLDNGISIFANPNDPSKGTSFTSQILAKRLGVPFLNKSFGSTTVDFHNRFFNARGGKTLRERITPAHRLQLLERDDGKCRQCREEVEDNRFEIDHIIRLANGGSHSESNLQVLCSPCHDDKSRREVGNKLYNTDQTVSYYNTGTLGIFDRVKTGIVHAFVHYHKYAVLTSVPVIANDGTRVEKPLLTKLDDGSIIVALDHQKCRTNIMIHKMKEHMLSVFSALNDVVPFDKDLAHHKSIPCGEYFVVMPEGSDICPTHGNDFYSHIMVRKLLKDKLIKLKNITHVALAQRGMCLPGDYYAGMCAELLHLVITEPAGSDEWKREVGIAKTCINEFIGILGIRHCNSMNVEIFSDLAAALRHRADRVAGTTSASIPVSKKVRKVAKDEQEDVSVQSINKKASSVSLFPMMFDEESKRNSAGEWVEVNPDRCDYIKMITRNSSIKNEGTMPIFRCILDIEAVELYESKKFGERYGKVICVNTDCVYIRLTSDSYGTAQEKANRLKKEAASVYWDKERTVKKYNAFECALPSPYVCDRKTEMSNEVYERTLPEYKILKDTGFMGRTETKKIAEKIVDDFENTTKDKSVLISSLAGTGKTTLTNAIIRQLIKRDIRFLALAPTHVAANLLGDGDTVLDTKGKHIGCTIDSAMTPLRSTGYSAFKNIKVIIIDEISQVKEQHWTALWHIKRQFGTRILLVGNFAQLAPVCDRSSDFDYENSSLLHELSNGRKLVLTKCRRAAKDEVELFEQYSYLAYEQEDKFDLRLFGEKETDLNICATNSKIIEINKIWMDKYTPDNEDEWMLCKTTALAKKIHCQDIICYEGLPVIACRTRQAEEFYNGEMWKVSAFSSRAITLVCDDRECTIPRKEFASLFRPAYAISCHKAQGQTLRRKFTIHQWEHMSNRHRYVSVSRGTKLGHVNIVRE